MSQKYASFSIKQDDNTTTLRHADAKWNSGGNLEMHGKKYRAFFGKPHHTFSHVFFDVGIKYGRIMFGTGLASAGMTMMATTGVLLNYFILPW